MEALVIVNPSIALIKVITEDGVENRQLGSADATLQAMFRMIKNEGYEIVSSSGGMYTLKKGATVQQRPQFITKGMEASL